MPVKTEPKVPVSRALDGGHREWNFLPPGDPFSCRLSWKMMK